MKKSISGSVGNGTRPVGGAYSPDEQDCIIRDRLRGKSELMDAIVNLLRDLTKPKSPYNRSRLMPDFELWRNGLDTDLDSLLHMNAIYTAQGLAHTIAIELIGDLRYSELSENIRDEFEDLFSESPYDFAGELYDVAKETLTPLEASLFTFCTIQAMFLKGYWPFDFPSENPDVSHLSDKSIEEREDFLQSKIGFFCECVMVNDSIAFLNAFIQLKRSVDYEFVSEFVLDEYYYLLERQSGRQWTRHECDKFVLVLTKRLADEFPGTPYETLADIIIPVIEKIGISNPVSMAETIFEKTKEALPVLDASIFAFLCVKLSLEFFCDGFWAYLRGYDNEQS